MVPILPEVRVIITQFYQPLLSLTSIYLQITPDVFQLHGAILSGSMRLSANFNSTTSELTHMRSKIKL
jgi:hypothetical protein